MVLALPDAEPSRARSWKQDVPGMTSLFAAARPVLLFLLAQSLDFVRVGPRADRHRMLGKLRV
jgi:hypothetical protein